MPIPKPLTKGHLCEDCKGTGADIERTLVYDAKQPGDEPGYIVCVTCQGRGLDPAEYFNWGSHHETV